MRRDPFMLSMIAGAGLRSNEASEFFEHYIDDLILFQKELPHFGVLRAFKDDELIINPVQILYSLNIGGVQVPAMENTRGRYFLARGSIRVGKKGVLEGIDSLGERYACYIPLIRKMKKPF